MDFSKEARKLVKSEDHPQIEKFSDTDTVIEGGCAGVYAPWLLESYPDKPHGHPHPDSSDEVAVNRAFGRLWPDCDAKRHLVTVVAPASGARFPVHAGIAPLVAEGLRRMELGIGGAPYRCDPSQCGAFNCRAIGGTNSPSNHSGGLAIDINWRDNPFRRGARYSMPEWVWRMWESLGFYWGGRYSDFMHVEFLGTPDDARRLISGLGGGASGVQGPTRPTLARGSSGPGVEEVQRMLRIAVDGKYGPGTEKAVRDFQAANGLQTDGKVGPATWKKLLEGDDMQLTDTYRDWAGNEQSVRGTFDNVDKRTVHIVDRINETANAVLALADEARKRDEEIIRILRSIEGKM